jgi:hypothetical protein
MLELMEPTISGLAAGKTGRQAGLNSALVTPLPQRTLLPKRPGEPRFAPQQYFYPASKSGVVPSLLLSEANFDEDSDVWRDAA